MICTRPELGFLSAVLFLSLFPVPGKKNCHSPDISMSTFVFFVDRAEHRDDALGHAIYQVLPCVYTHRFIGMIKKRRKASSARFDSVQLRNDLAHKTRQFVSSVCVPQF